MDEVTDPLQSLADAHLKRMQEIADEGFKKTQDLCGDSIEQLKKSVGLKNAVLDKTLEALGITEQTKE